MPAESADEAIAAARPLQAQIKYLENQLAEKDIEISNLRAQLNRKTEVQQIISEHSYAGTWFAFVFLALFFSLFEYNILSIQAYK